MKQREQVAAFAVAVTIGALANVAAAPTTSAQGVATEALACETTHVIGVHGLNEEAISTNHNMGQTLGGTGGFYETLAAKVPTGTYVPDGVVYPKTTSDELTKMVDDAKKKKDPKPLRKASQHLASMVSKGAGGLDAKIKALVADAAANGCTPDQGDIVVVGYSEGAWVTDFFTQMFWNDAKNVEAIVLFGDPQYRPCHNPIRRADCITTVGEASWHGLIQEAQALNLEGQGFDVRKADVPVYLPIPDSANDYANELWDHTRSYCLTYTTSSRRGPVMHRDPICASKVPFNFPPPTGSGLDDHTKGYGLSHGKAPSVFDQAVTFLGSVL